MRVCQLFSAAVVSLTMLSMAGCAAPSGAKATGLSGQASPLYQAMQHAAQDSYAKR